MDYSEIRKQLQTKLHELVARAKDIEENLSQPGEADWEENATDSEGDEVMIGIGELTKQEIQQIEQALQLIDAGTYGKCQICGKSIERARLELLPFTSSCVSCA